MKFRAIVAVLAAVVFSGVAYAEEYDSLWQQYVGEQRLNASGEAERASEPYNGGSIYGVDVSVDDLLYIDKETAGCVTIGPVRTQVVGGLAWDPESGLLYGTDTATTSLVTIDPCDGSTTVIGRTGIMLLHGLALDPSGGILYAVNTAGNFYMLDKFTGEATLVGSTGYFGISALDFDPTSGILYGAFGDFSTSGYLITIDPETGEGTFVADTHRINGLCFDADGTMYATENGMSSSKPTSLYVIDKMTGAWSLVGTTSADNILGIDLPIANEAAIEACVDFAPKALNLNSEGRWVTCSISLPAEYDVGDVNSQTIVCADEITADWAWVDEQEQILMVKFSRSNLVDTLTELGLTGDVGLLVTGKLNDGTRFEGVDVIKVTDCCKKK